MNITRSGITMLATVLALSLAACKKEEGPAERAGKAGMKVALCEERSLGGQVAGGAAADDDQVIAHGIPPVQAKSGQSVPGRSPGP